MTSLLVNASRIAARKRPNMRSLRTWAGIHRWTSIISTLFLLILSLTGLPLIFQKEIDEAFGSSGTLAEVPASNGAPTLDSIVAAALARHPGDTMISLEFAKRWPIVETRSAPTPDGGPTRIHREVIDLRTGQLTTMPQRRGPAMQFLHTLHADLYLGLPGGLFLAGMALVVIAAVISGLILYPPFVRRFGFGTVRTRTRAENYCGSTCTI
ncbi:PepSY domain-containing protein [Bradyrhizobium barranii subsp. apii]|uniref:PepSY domain-containing protein n=1 Tax=Bradyrhizobium barranii subsp. apii TaxID=2819348 RepID=A0A8U0FKG9_9BRAD|nr:PepSY domain-containing protein [Bradyrhizobium barranii]UPT87654.1 PepSY domain-containing protein [Bradyrhizobium barranii subsp. apii]UPT96818.1 PepSY domain-containing protein [Bradyrhizobium barranii subsp. apii]